MPTKSVEIVISAEDKASSKLLSASRNIEKTNAKIVETGKKAKASNETIAQFVSLLASGDIGAASGALTAIGDKFGDIGDEVKAAKFQALAFKAVVVGAIASAVIAVGRLIAQHWVAEMEKAGEQARRLGRQLADETQDRLSKTLESVKEIADEEERRLAAQQAFVELGAAQQRQLDTIKRAEEEIRKLRDFNPFAGGGGLGGALLNVGQSMTGSRGSQIEQQQAIIDEAQEAIDGQKDSIRELSQLKEGLHESDLERLEEEKKAAIDNLNEIREKKQEEAKRQLEAEKKAAIDNLNAIRKRWAEEAKLAERAQKDLAKIREEESDKAFERRAAFLADAPDVKATESRLLSTGGGADANLDEQKKTTKATEETAAEVRELRQIIERQASQQSDSQLVGVS